MVTSRTARSRERRLSVRKLALRLTNELLAALSLEVRRISPRGTTARAQPAAICEDFVEALYKERGGEPSAFLCETSHCVQVTGFSLAPTAWHPFRETLREFLASGHGEFEGSILEHFYALWRPQTAGQAFPGFAHLPESFHRFPPACMHLKPLESLVTGENRTECLHMESSRLEGTWSRSPGASERRPPTFWPRFNRVRSLRVCAADQPVGIPTASGLST